MELLDRGSRKEVEQKDASKEEREVLVE